MTLIVLGRPAVGEDVVLRLRALEEGVPRVVLGFRQRVRDARAAPWRTARIYHVLESGRKFSPADMLALQTDVHSEAHLFAAERLVYAVDHASKPSVQARQAADLMRNWDGRMLASLAAPTIAEIMVSSSAP